MVLVGSNSEQLLPRATTREQTSTPYLRRWRLIALCVALSLAETITLWGAGLEGSIGIAPQISAPPPFDVFHDLRWLLVFHRSWITFGAGVVVLVVLRSTITALIVREAWPDSLPKPSFSRAWRTAMWFTIAALVLMLPWALLLFGLALVPLSWLFFTAVPPALVVALLIGPGAVGPGWWRRPPPLRAVGWTLLAFFVLSMDSLVLGLAPPAIRPLAAIAAGLFNGWAWYGVVGAVAPRIRERRFRPLAPALLAAIVVVVVGGAAIGFSVVTGRRHHTETAGSASTVTGRPALIVTGFGSSWDGKQRIALGSGVVTQRFSYKGLRDDDRPVAYTSVDTQHTLPELDALLARQVDALYRRSHKPVSLIAESEGALVAKTYLLGHPSAPVTNLIMLSPLVMPGRVSYTARGVEGWGVAAGWGLRGLDHALRALAPFNLSPDSPLIQSIDANGPLLEDILGCPAPGVRQVALVALADAVGVPPSAIPSSIDGTPVVVVPAFHGGMLGEGSVRHAVGETVRTDTLPNFGPWRPVEQLLSAASSAWQVPSLPADLRPQQARSAAAGSPSSANSCDQIATAIQHWR